MRKGSAILLSEFHETKNSKILKKLDFLDKTIQNIFLSLNNLLKHTVLQWRSTVASISLCRVAPWCSRRTASFHYSLGTLTWIQNLGGLWFSPPSIDIHSNYGNFRRTSSNLSELLQRQMTCCQPNQRIRELIWYWTHKLQLASTAVHNIWWVVDSKREKDNSWTVLDKLMNVKMKEERERERERKREIFPCSFLFTFT